MDTTNNVRTSERQNVVVALQVASVIAESLAPVAPLIETVLLDHSAHGSVEEHYAFLQQLLQTLEARAALDLIYWSHSERRCRYTRRSAFLTGIEQPLRSLPATLAMPTMRTGTAHASAPSTATRG
jgi:hypothetical protein